MTDNKLKCFIIGYPIKKPRSTKIWNNFLITNKINAKMKTLEMKKSQINNFLIEIKNDPLFLSTLVTMPYKKKILEFIDNKHSSVINTNSANLVCKKNNKLKAYNTDVLGAEHCLKNEIRKYNTIIIIGIGGSGEAIFRYLFSKYKNKKFILISSKFKFKSSRVKILNKINKNILSNKSLIINCTPIGSDLKKNLINKSPISKSLFKYINNYSFIFDIIYKPKKTLLAKLSKLYNIKYLNGLEMNSIQAAIGLKIVFKNV